MSITAMKQALEFLESGDFVYPTQLATDLRQAIEQAKKREWVGLTDEEIKPCWYEACQTDLELTSQLVIYFARTIEAKLKEKNNG
jgi:hypothetical protein